MPRIYADNVVMAKAKSLYGHRLTDEDYNQLLAKKTVGEVASYLKRETIYSGALAEVKEELVHRGQLEDLVRKHIHDLYMRLAHYLRDDDLFAKIYTGEIEVSQLLTILRMLAAGSMDKYVVTFPAYMSRYLSFDLFYAAKAKSYDELLELMGHSAYYGILGSFRPVSSDIPPDISAIETALLTHYYKRSLALVRENNSGEALHDLEEMLLSRIDQYNLTVIYRLKKYFGSEPDEIRRKLIHINSLIRPSDYEKLIAASDAPAAMEQMYRLHLLHRLPPVPDFSVEHLIGSYRKKRSQQLFHSSINPMVVLMSYMILLQIEIGNIVTIIEGIRYGVPADDLRAMLI